MKTRIISIVFLLSFLVVVGCQPTSQKDDLTIRENVYVGTKGLEMTFVPGYPQSRLYDTQQLNVLVELRNKGIEDLTGTLTLEGFDPNIIRFDENTIRKRQFGTLRKKTSYDPEGGFQLAEFSSKEIRLPEGVDSYRPRIIVTSCYPYKTIAGVEICVDPNPFAIGQEKVCRPGAYSANEGQGSPLSVNSVVVDSTQSKVLLRIKIGNKGGGRTINRDSLGKCPSELQFSDLDVVNYRVTIGGSQEPLRCTPERTVRLFNEQTTISCEGTIPPGTGNAYKTTITVTMDYGYKQSLSRDIEIIRAPRGG
ncbi:MAG: hypothetical protein QW331_01885 [Candidatus Woesearchaeota archaeon]